VSPCCQACSKPLWWVADRANVQVASLIAYCVLKQGRSVQHRLWQRKHSSVSTCSRSKLQMWPGSCPHPQVLAGIQAPSMGRKAAVAPTDGETGAEAAPAPAIPSAASIAASSNAEPFAPQAKFLSETRALNRWVGPQKSADALLM
jgi:hypothetical protein